MLSRAYVVLTLERTGSNLLCDALAGTGLVGYADEWYGRSHVHELATATGTAHPSSTADKPRLTSFGAYVEAIAERTAVNDVFGVKLHRYQYEHLASEHGISSPREVVPGDRQRNVRWVLLTRLDKDRQAISTYLAQRTGVYAVPTDAPVRKVRHGTPYWPASVDADPGRELERIRTTIDAHEASWLAWIADEGLDPLLVTYEDLTDRYEETVRAVLRHVGATDAGDVPPPRLRMQRDERTEELFRRWRASENVRDDTSGDAR